MANPDNDNQIQVLETAVQQFLDSWLDGQEPEIDEFVKDYPGFETQVRQRICKLHRIDGLLDSLVHVDDSDFQGTISLPDLVGQKLGNFEVGQVIGRGGMGVVYLARDTKLDRPVAIKSIPPNLAGDSTTRTRFRREARLLASLNHPNIGAIYDIIEQDAGAGYLILEYVPGQTLAQRIASEPLRFEEAFSIGQQIAEAISAAHDKGVIHRDLKPGNIKITPAGRAKVLDFGLAKASVAEDRSGDATITQPGRVMGTPAYMSPEQACGKPTDRRSDIWSFGCLMYEMLTGRLPFDGDTATEILARIIEREPDWQALPQDTPASIRGVLCRCLEKDPSRRLQHIADAASEIGETLSLLASGSSTSVHTLRREQPMGEASPGQIKSLAVLPLQNLTGDPEQEYFADGMTEALIADLAKIEALQVRSRTSIMQYKGVKKSLPEIARELNVDVVVEGSVLRVADRVRITAQLIQAPTDTHLWADSYERDLRDILTLLGEVARTIARQIEIALTPDQEALLAARRPVNPETYEAYLKGMFHLNKMTPEGVKKGLEYLHEAIEKDPADPLAYGALALGYAASAHGPGAPLRALEQTEKAALKALELDETLAEAQAALAHIKLYRDWDWEAAEHAFQYALKLNPSLTLTRAHYAFYLLIFEHVDDGLAEMRYVQEVDPLTPYWPALQGWQYWWIGRYDKATDEARKSLELDSDFAVGLYVLGSAYADKGMYEEAIQAHWRAGEGNRAWKAALGRTYAMAGRQDEARQVLVELEADLTTWDTWFIAQIYAVLGEKDEAFRWLEVAYGPPHHPYMPWIKHSPALRLLRDDPRYADLLRRMSLPA